MKHKFSKSFFDKIESTPYKIQEKFWEKLEFLLKDIRHPSLHAKKYDEVRGIWQARVDRNYRFYFLIERDAYIILDIRAHPK